LLLLSLAVVVLLLLLLLTGPCRRHCDLAQCQPFPTLCTPDC
jgi:hypothetical protein